MGFSERKNYSADLPDGSSSVVVCRTVTDNAETVYAVGHGYYEVPVGWVVIDTVISWQFDVMSADQLAASGYDEDSDEESDVDPEPDSDDADDIPSDVNPIDASDFKDASKSDAATVQE